MSQSVSKRVSESVKELESQSGKQSVSRRVSQLESHPLCEDGVIRDEQ